MTRCLAVALFETPSFVLERAMFPLLPFFLFRFSPPVGLGRGGERGRVESGGVTKASVRGEEKGGGGT